MLGEVRPWQLIFLILGGAGVLFTLLMLAVKEPARRGAGAGVAVPLADVGRYIRANRRTVLLHNFGFLLLAEVFPPHFANYCRLQEANLHLNYNVIERFLLGIDRDQLSGWLLRLWGLPEEVVFALRHQSDASYDGPAHRYANLIYIAVRLLRLHGIGGTPPEPIPEALYERLNLDPAAAMAAIQQVVDASSEIDGIAANLAA